jgi:long-chain acyl-CoA synthetase
MRWFDPARWLKLAEQHRVQGSALVPSMIQMLLAQPLEQADLSELITVSSGAAPLAADVRREFEAWVPTAIIYEEYGCTEAATFISASPFGARRLGSVGLPVPGCEVSIQDDAGQLLPPDQDGEICVRSPGVMTGDIGHLDADGYLYVVDRKKDLIIRGGFKRVPARRRRRPRRSPRGGAGRDGRAARPGGWARRSSPTCRCGRTRRPPPPS